MKKNLGRILLPLLILAVLAAAFWYGDGSGRDVPPAPTLSAAAHMPAPTPTSAHTPDSTLPGAASPASAPDSTSAPTPTPTPPSTPGPETTPATEKLCTLSINCGKILDNLDLCPPEKRDLVPADGWILAPVAVAFQPEESVFDVLLRVCREKSLHMEYTDTPLYDSAYIEGIGNLYEFDVGELSGWMYSVNGYFPNYSCSRYALAEGDRVEFLYTCDWGADLGGAV